MEKNISDGFVSKKHKIIRRLVFLAAALAICFACLFWMAKNNSGEGSITAEAFFLKNDDGTYTYCEAVLPATTAKGYKLADTGADSGTGASSGSDAGSDAQAGEKVPLVLIAHGFTGTLNSGGGKELADRLARQGIASVRMDFDHRTAPRKNAPKTNAYTLSTMANDMVNAAKHMISNYSIDVERMGVYGRSMGGRVAMTLANQSLGGFDYRALALVAPAGNANAMIYYMGGDDRWEAMKEAAQAEGFAEKQVQKLSLRWFEEFEEYNPAADGMRFGSKPVLVICNTLDHVVTEDTSKECAAAYENSRVITVTTEDAHGYEMSYDESELKDYLMAEIVKHFKDNL